MKKSVVQYNGVIIIDQKKNLPYLVEIIYPFPPSIKRGNTIKKAIKEWAKNFGEISKITKYGNSFTFSPYNTKKFGDMCNEEETYLEKLIFTLRETLPPDAIRFYYKS